MTRKVLRDQWLGALGGAGVAVGVLLGLAIAATPVWAQGRSVFDSFFGPFSGPRYAPVERPADFTRAPPPRKLETQPTSTVMVFGDSMADWLAYGLEDALAETPDLGVVRKHRATAGLIRYDARNEAQDWAQVVRDAIAAEKPQFVVMMVGLKDRQSIRERPAARQTPSGPVTPLAIVPPAGQAPGQQPPAAAAESSEQPPSIVAPEAARNRAGADVFEFRTEPWAEQYAKRIDATIAALRGGGVPVFWVGLPSLRGPKSTSDMLYLNDLFRTRAEKAGIAFIDIWDGFVDESGRYVVQGPDFEGQTRRLRVSDGVHFTKAGARKLAHYVEREIRRIAARGPGFVALPATEPQLQTPAQRSGALTARPLAGPVVPLTGNPSGAEGLAGGEESRNVFVQPIVNRVLVKGEALATPAGRSDDFAWPRRGVAPFGADPVVATTNDLVVAMRPPAETTVAAPKVDPRAVGANQRRTTGRAQNQAQQQQQQQQQRRGQSQSRFQVFPFR
ncbi:MAG: DUF459 domain-containing protein [Alphaproteobacteria bacterium]|nr:DUF459 domain-containing protein [Alphaproteobacteria bacterium]